MAAATEHHTGSGTGTGSVLTWSGRTGWKSGPAGSEASVATAGDCHSVTGIGVGTAGGGVAAAVAIVMSRESMSARSGESLECLN